MLKYFGISLLFCCFCSLLSAQQTTPKNSLGLSGGISAGWLTDLNYSPLNYKNNGSAFGLHYRRHTKKNYRLYANIELGLTTLKNDISNSFDADNYLANIEIGYLKPTNLPNDRLQLYVGGQYHTFLNTVFFDGTESISFFGVHGVDIAGQLDYQVNEKSQLTMGLSIPVFGQLVRPPYTGWNKFVQENENTPVVVMTTGEWTSLNDYFGINWTLDYRYTLSQKWDLAAHYRFQYYQTDVLKESKIAANQLRVGLHYKF